MSKVIKDNNMYNNSKYVSLNSKINFEDLKYLDMVCLNDTYLVDDFEKTKDLQNKFFQSIFSKKSQFEK